METHPSILPWRIPWTEKPGRLQSTGLQTAGHDCVINTFTLSTRYHFRDGNMMGAKKCPVPDLRKNRKPKNPLTLVQGD